MTTFFLRSLAASSAVLFCGFAVQAKAPVRHSKKATHKKLLQKTDTSASSQWKPDAKLLSQLQPERQFGPLSMRIPIGFTVDQQELPSTNKAHLMAYAVKGPTRPDKTFCLIYVAVGVAAPGYQPGSLNSLLESNPFLKEQPNVTKSEIEEGEANDFELSRQYFKFPSDPGSSHFIHGLNHAAIGGNAFVLIGAIDAEPYNATSLPLAEAAALTLRKTN